MMDLSEWVKLEGKKSNKLSSGQIVGKAGSFRHCWSKCKIVIDTVKKKKTFRQVLKTTKKFLKHVTVIQHNYLLFWAFIYEKGKLMFTQKPVQEFL
jgi:hypothetical protein